MSRYRIVPRTDIGLPDVVRSSTGAPRPPLRNARWVTVHWTGVERNYAGADTGEAIRSIERYVAGLGRPWEYNYVIPQAGADVYEYAGAYQAAHSAGENSRAVGVLFLNGIHEPLTVSQVDRVRWLVAVCRYFGIASPTSVVTPHGDMPGAATSCPGPSARWWLGEMRKPYIEPPPAPAGTVLLTRVQAGDGWYSIARRCYGPDDLARRVDALIAANRDTPRLTPGAIVNVPGRAV